MRHIELRPRRRWLRRAPTLRQADRVENAARIVGERFGEITELIIAEVGGTALKAGFEFGLVIDASKEAASLAARRGMILPSPVDDTENFVYRKPRGRRGVNDPSIPVLPHT